MEESDQCLESEPKRSRSEQNIEELNNWPSNVDGSGDPSSKENEQSSSNSCSISSGADCIDTKANSASVSMNENSTDSGLDMIFGSEMLENLLNKLLANETQKNEHIQSETCAVMPENTSVPEKNLNGDALEVEEGDKATGSMFAKKRQLRNRNRNYRCAKKRSSSLSLSSSPSSSTSSVLKFDIGWLFRSTEEQPKKETEENFSDIDSLQLCDNELSPWETSTDCAREADDSINFCGGVEEDESPSLSGSNSSSSSSTDDDSDKLFSLSALRSDQFSGSLISLSDLHSENKNEIKSLLTKPKPPYNWNSTYELMRRESGLRGDGRVSFHGCNGESFAVRYYASRHVVERMKLSHALLKHNGCVNCLNFNRAGNLLVSGSDDGRLIIWDWAHSKTKYVNQQTIKGVNFFGPNCEYIISGSDCGNIYYWDKNTEAIVNFMPGDISGVVNCVEPHPSVPILATSGLDDNIKIWTPSAETYPPDLADLEHCVSRNMARTTLENVDRLDHGQFRFFMRYYLSRRLNS
uniref:Uncharacterized protein n=1 Tax=Glossina palpalis gambiensis TaxID=67801 RepID=A0A1B0AXU1_9MUSC